jgi:hypothetical protein
MTKFTAIFRSHVWDSGIAAMASRARRCCGSGGFVVAADETNGPLSVEPFSKLSHTDDFASQGLPNLPRDQVLWWNADYVLYLVRREFPENDYYVMLEYDVFVNCDLAGVVEQCAAGGIDLIARDLKPIDEDHWSRPSISEFTKDAWWALIPFLIVSARAVDALLQTRLALAERWRRGDIREWPYCETFIPTVIQQRPDLRSADASHFVDSALLRFRPFLSTRDPALGQPDLVAHPVMTGERFVKAFIAHEPPGSHLLSDGRLRRELRGEDLADLRSVLGDGFAPRTDSQWIGGSDPAAATSRADAIRGVDLARDRPATQSSHSVWSRGATAEEDARRAVSGELASDYAFHTAEEEDPWWQVDLTRECDIHAIEIVNRPDHPYRFTRFRIDSSVDDTRWVTRFAKTDGSLVSSDAAEPALFVMPRGFSARYIRIVQLGKGVMNLRRIRVLGTDGDAAVADAAPSP